MKNIKEYLPFIIVIVIILLFLKFNSCQSKNFKDEVNLYKNLLNDTLIKIRNKDSSQTATINLLQDKNVKALLELENQKGINKKLQDEVKKYKNNIKDGGSVTVIESSTTFSNTNHNDSTVRHPNDSCNPIYYSNKSNKWIEYSTVANKDSTSLTLKIKNNFTVVIGEEKYGFLNLKRKPTALVNSENPYTDIKEMKAFEVKDTRPNRIHLSIQAGYGITLKGFGPYLGGGFSYVIF